MTDSRSPKFIGTKLGLASALALGSFSMLGSEAWATPVGVASDTLQIGTGTVFTIPEGTTEPTSVTAGPVGTSASAFLGSRTILLTEPGSTSISDIVTASITGEFGEEQLTVTLTSGGETSLTAPPLPVGTFATLVETGAMNLGPTFDTLFGNRGDPLPAINVFSDVEAVPEPASLALLGSGLAGLAFVRRRRRKI